MTDFRNRENGDKYAPRRGRPPETPKGYCRDERDPFLFHPILDNCIYRVPYTEQYDCGRVIGHTFCDYHEKDITGGDCIKCPDLQNQ